MKRLKKIIKRNLTLLQCFINRKFLFKKLLNENKGLHVGCGDIRISNLINMDSRPTVATDIVANSTNLSIFPSNSFLVVFSNAFFEHLYKEDRVLHLTDLKRTLKKNGMAIYLGMPDFEVIARSYLGNVPGILYKKFDVNEAYRYTHGNPEQADGWWLEQLHKSLFDTKSLTKLLEESGFRNFVIFDYAFRTESIPLNMGFIAFKTKPKLRITENWVCETIRNYSADVSTNTVKILTNK